MAAKDAAEFIRFDVIFYYITNLDHPLYFLFTEQGVSRRSVIDLAAKHGLVQFSVDRIYRGDIEKLQKALEEEKQI